MLKTDRPISGNFYWVVNKCALEILVGLISGNMVSLTDGTTIALGGRWAADLEFFGPIEVPAEVKARLYEVSSPKD